MPLLSFLVVCSLLTVLGELLAIRLGALIFSTLHFTTYNFVAHLKHNCKKLVSWPSKRVGWVQRYKKISYHNQKCRQNCKMCIEKPSYSHEPLGYANVTTNTNANIAYEMCCVYGRATNLYV